MKKWLSALLKLINCILLLIVGFFGGVILMLQVYKEIDNAIQLNVIRNCAEVGYHFVDFPAQKVGVLMECPFAKIGKVRNNDYDRALILNNELEDKREKLNGLER
jgi:hypothetical protein